MLWHLYSTAKLTLSAKLLLYLSFFIGIKWATILLFCYWLKQSFFCCSVSVMSMGSLSTMLNPQSLTTYLALHGEPCHTLNYVASNTHKSWSGVVLRFLPGNHSLNCSLYISSNSNLHLTTLDLVTSTQNLSANIHCPSSANFHFCNVSNITTDGLSFHNCGIPEKYLFDTSAEGTNVTNFWVDYIEIQSWHTTDTIRVYNGFGRSVISHSESLDLDCPYPCIGLVSI